MLAASIHVSLNELADITIDKMLQPGRIFASTPSGPRSKGQRQDPGLCNNNANTQQEQSPNDAVFCAFNVEQGQLDIYPLATSLLRNMILVANCLHLTNLVLIIMVCLIES